MSKRAIIAIDLQNEYWPVNRHPMLTPNRRPKWVRLNFCDVFMPNAGDVQEGGRYQLHHTSAVSASSAC